MRSFQRALVEFNNLWIDLIFKDFYWVYLKYLAHLFKSGAELGAWEVFFFCSRRNCSLFFSIFFQLLFGIVYIWSTYHSFDQSIWFTTFFFLKESCILFQTWICWIVIYLVSVPVIIGRITKMYSNCFNGKLWTGHFSWQVVTRKLWPGYFTILFFMWHPIRSGFLKSLFLSQKLFNIVLKLILFW